MTNKTPSFPQATRSGEYIAFFNIQFPTMEGPAYVFMACDAYSEFGFNTGTEPDEKPEIVLKHIHLLTENKDFIRHRHKGFTFVFDRYLELSDRINAILHPLNGRAMFDSEYHNKVAAPLRNSILKRMRSRK